MNDRKQYRALWNFGLITILMLAWNVMVFINFMVQINPDMTTPCCETEQATGSTQIQR